MCVFVGDRAHTIIICLFLLCSMFTITKFESFSLFSRRSKCCIPKWTVCVLQMCKKAILVREREEIVCTAFNSLWQAFSALHYGSLLFTHSFAFDVVRSKKACNMFL